MQIYLNIDQKAVDTGIQAYLFDFKCKIFDYLKEIVEGDVKDEQAVLRKIKVLKMFINESERRGTSGVRPHNSILKGELIERVAVKYLSFENNWGVQKLEKTLIMNLYSSATVWEFKSEIAKILELTPRYIQFEFGKEVI